VKIGFEPTMTNEKDQRENQQRPTPTEDAIRRFGPKIFEVLVYASIAFHLMAIVAVAYAMRDLTRESAAIQIAAILTSIFIGLATLAIAVATVRALNRAADLQEQSAAALLNCHLEFGYNLQVNGQPLPDWKIVRAWVTCTVYLKNKGGRIDDVSVTVDGCHTGTIPQSQYGRMPQASFGRLSPGDNIDCRFTNSDSDEPVKRLNDMVDQMHIEIEHRSGDADHTYRNQLQARVESIMAGGFVSPSHTTGLTANFLVHERKVVVEFTQYSGDRIRMSFLAQFDYPPAFCGHAYPCKLVDKELKFKADS